MRCDNFRTGLGIKRNSPAGLRLGESCRFCGPGSGGAMSRLCWEKCHDACKIQIETDVISIGSRMHSKGYMKI